MPVTSESIPYAQRGKGAPLSNLSEKSMNSPFRQEGFESRNVLFCIHEIAPVVVVIPIRYRRIPVVPALCEHDCPVNGGFDAFDKLLSGHIFTP